MVLNYIWIALFVIGVLVGVIKLVFMGDYDALPAMMDSTFEASKVGFEMTLGLTGTLTFLVPYSPNSSLIYLRGTLR